MTNYSYLVLKISSYFIMSDFKSYIDFKVLLEMEPDGVVTGAFCPEQISAWSVFGTQFV